VVAFAPDGGDVEPLKDILSLVRIIDSLPRVSP